jgi:pyrimidine-nucleoside phosphorylase
MDAPLGSFVGNTLELKEAIATLKGEAGGELAEISTALAAEMVSLARGVGFERAKDLAEEALKSGLAFEKFKEWIGAQGGDLNYIENPNLFGSAKFVYEIKADTDAYIKRMNAENIGLAAMELGAGRKTKDELIDFAAGIELLKKPGDRIKKGDTLARLYTDRENSRTAAEELFISSLELGKNKPEPIPIIHKIIR